MHWAKESSKTLIFKSYKASKLQCKSGLIAIKYVTVSKLPTDMCNHLLPFYIHINNVYNLCTLRSFHNRNNVSIFLWHFLKIPFIYLVCKHKAWRTGKSGFLSGVIILFERNMIKNTIPYILQLHRCAAYKALQNIICYYPPLLIILNVLFTLSQMITIMGTRKKIFIFPWNNKPSLSRLSHGHHHRHKFDKM